MADCECVWGEYRDTDANSNQESDLTLSAGLHLVYKVKKGTDTHTPSNEYGISHIIIE